MENNRSGAVAANATSPAEAAATRPTKTAPDGRPRCAHSDCITPLSIHNPGRYCGAHDADEYRAGPAFPLARNRFSPEPGARPGDVRELLERIMTTRNYNLEELAHVTGVSTRQLHAIRTGLGQGRGRPIRTVSRTLVDRMLTNLGLEHERCRWECLS